MNVTYFILINRPCPISVSSFLLPLEVILLNTRGNREDTLVFSNIWIIVCEFVKFIRQFTTVPRYLGSFYRGHYLVSGYHTSD